MHKLEGALVGAIAEKAIERRSAAPRVRVMMAAEVRASGLSAPVRIRNLSGSGALLEGDQLPEAGALIVLARNKLAADADVVWKRGARCGVRFRDRVVVDTWRGVEASAPSPHLRVVENEPQTASISAPDLLGHSDALIKGELNKRVGEELAYLQRLIEGIGNELVSNPLIVHRHGATLQQFDRATQILGHLARVVTSAEPMEAARSIGMTELRGRLLR